MGELPKFFEIQCAAATEIESGDRLSEGAEKCWIGHGEVVMMLTLLDECDECSHVRATSLSKCDAELVWVHENLLRR
jgi:hypothetical protein